MNNGSEPNAKRLLWAGFFAIFAAGVGFSVRAGILGDWARDYGFTKTELGDISGGGLWGFGLVIAAGCLLADKIGYGILMGFAFLMHVLSFALQLATPEVYERFGSDGVKLSLTIAMVMFSIANGTCEVVVNPMVAALYPREKTHYLNILHAGWPGGLIAGGLVSYFMNGGTIGDWAPLGKVHWMVQMSMFFIPTLIYGSMVLGQHLPRSEASQAGVDFGTMLAVFASPILLLLLVIHALVGYVELGTDSWIGNITGSIMDDPARGLLLFVYTSGLMFTLRFFAGPIEHHLSPLGLLCISGIFGAIGLTLLGGAEGILMCVVAATVYALGKTFLWPTMLAVASERFPKGGAIVIGAMGGAGMLSAGLLGVPGIGFKQDYNTSSELRANAPSAFERYAAEKEKTFLGVFRTKALDGAKVGVLELSRDISKLEEQAAKEESSAKKAKIAEEIKEKTLEQDKTIERNKLKDWWEINEKYKEQDEKTILEARLHGGRKALELTAIVPATMAVLYLFLILYFKTQGGY